MQTLPPSWSRSDSQSVIDEIDYLLNQLRVTPLVLSHVCKRRSDGRLFNAGIARYPRVLIGCRQFQGLHCLELESDFVFIYVPGSCHILWSGL